MAARLLDRVADLADAGRIESGQKRVERVPPRAALDADDVLLRQRRQHRGADAGVLQRAHRHLAAARLQQLDGLLLLRRQAGRRRFEDDEAVVADAFRVRAGDRRS